MYPPVDYPVQDSADNAGSPLELNYAKLMDRHAQEKPISMAMIQSAQVQLETAQQLPAAAKPKEAKTLQPAPVLKRLLNTIR